MAGYMEPASELTPEARDFSRALNSLKEEVEAIDWYHQRVVTTTDSELAGLMAHNRDEEIEHAVMTIEWLRRNMPGWDETLRTYLFKEGSIIALEEGTKNQGEKVSAKTKFDSLGIGKITK